jgi:hypothetical protein
MALWKFLINMFFDQFFFVTNYTNFHELFLAFFFVVFG